MKADTAPTRTPTRRPNAKKRLEVAKAAAEFNQGDWPFLFQPSGALLCFMLANVKVMAIMMRNTQEL